MVLINNVNVGISDVLKRFTDHGNMAIKNAVQTVLQNPPKRTNDESFFSNSGKWSVVNRDELLSNYWRIINRDEQMTNYSSQTVASDQW